VVLAKQLLGESELNKLRAKMISMHSDVIANFVEAADTTLGQTVLRALYQIADKNGNGTIEEDELAAALHALGFDWLKETQIKGILGRADLDENGVIDLQEWIQEAPKTLRTNLVKLAKKNGGDLGLLV
jgi:Ca2+-binding EF-hand superfamily protein